MRYLKITLVAVLCFILCSCNAKKPLDDTRWYTDDINNTIRTVATFDSNAHTLTINYMVLDEGRAERTKVAGLKFEKEVLFYRDYGKKIPEELNDGTDTHAFAIYHSEEDFNADQNVSVTYYHFEEENMVTNGNICMPLKGDIAKETDSFIAKHMAMIGE